MSHDYTATIRWKAEGDFASGRYSRAHVWRFDGGVEVPGSASPLVVPAPWSDAAAVDPEEAFTAAISSCHMLWFLDLARQAGFACATYEDRAVARMGGHPTPWIQTVDLFPVVTWTGAAPGPEELATLHAAAHDRCFIAHSVKSKIEVHP